MSEHGNNAAMHEALVKIREYIITGNTGYEPKELLELILNWCDSSLIEPPRNCDVGTAQEQYERFRDYCYTKKCPSITKDNTFSQIAFTWAQLPYEVETPEVGTPEKF